MTERPADPLHTQFESTGSLEPPRWKGRVVRLLIGLWLLSGLYNLLSEGWPALVGTHAPTRWEWWAFAVLGFWLLPYVVNIGFTKSWRRRPQVVLAAAIVVAVVLDTAIYGTWWAPPLGGLVWMWLVYFSAHLGGSFAVSALIATPGCEMRAFPHLWTRLTGRETHEHYCPGFIDNVDRWEARRES